MKYILIASTLIIISILAMKGGKMSADEKSAEMIDIFNASNGKVERIKTISKSDEEWRKTLTSDQYKIMRQKGTEPAFSGKCELPDANETGIYECAGCGNDLFKYESKFESGSGWPSFWEPVSDLNIKHIEDSSFGMIRIETVCAVCGSHLGHVFDDGPPPTGKRYCINSAVLKFKPTEKVYNAARAIFAAGCFWGVESKFRDYIGKGVLSTRVGYTGGTVKNPTYEQVCTHKTGHYEAVEIIYDPKLINYTDLLKIFWNNHNPLRSDGQGPDVGQQYRGVIFYLDARQKKLAEESKEVTQKSGKYKGEIKTLILPAKEFYPAEEYHQQYYEKKGVAPACNIF